MAFPMCCAPSNDTEVQFVDAEMAAPLSIARRRQACLTTATVCPSPETSAQRQVSHETVEPSEQASDENRSSSSAPPRSEGKAPGATFVVGLSKTQDAPTLGLRVVNKTMQVDIIRPGLVQNYNNSCKKPSQINEGDYIMEVNGVSGDWRKMLEIFNRDEKLCMTIMKS